MADLAGRREEGGGNRRAERIRKVGIEREEKRGKETKKQRVKQWSRMKGYSGEVVVGETHTHTERDRVRSLHLYGDSTYSTL
jgi:hypothetical protein